MSTREEEQGLVLELRAYQLEKLATNRHKSHWDEMTVREAMRTFKDEYYELLAAVSDGESPESVWREAADVANTAAMLARAYKQEARS